MSFSTSSRWPKRLAILFICMSILFVKQHVLIDIPCAVAIGEASWQLARIIRPEQMILSGGND